MEKKYFRIALAICAATLMRSACAEKSVGTKIRFIIRWIMGKFGILMLHKDKKYFTSQSIRFIKKHYICTVIY
jgi:hypothetical protein